MHRPLILLIAFLLGGLCPLSGEAVNLAYNAAEIRVVPGFDHVPLRIPITNGESIDLADVAVSSDLDWAVPSIDRNAKELVLNFSTRELIVSSTATISLDSGELTEFFISTLLSPMKVMRLEADPHRTFVYGIQFDPLKEGAVFRLNPYSGESLECLTVGKRPTDFVISPDGSELLAISSISKQIHVIDLDTFRLKEVIPLSAYGAWGGPGETTANIDVGPEDVIYYTDGTWGPVLRVYDRAAGTVIQSVLFSGSQNLTNETGFQDIAVTNDRSVLVAMPQYGWSAGSHSPVIASFDIAADGRVTPRETLESIGNFPREPFEAPVLLTGNSDVALMKTLATDPMDIRSVQRRFPSPVWSVSPDGLLAATHDTIYDFRTGDVLFSIPDPITNWNNSGTSAQAFTPDKYRFIYFNNNNQLVIIDLLDEIGGDIITGNLYPVDGSTILPPEELLWTAVFGVLEYDLYLGTNEAEVAAASTTSPSYRGRISGTSWAIPNPLVPGTTYFWRVDPVSGGQPSVMPVRSFTVSTASVDVQSIKADTVEAFENWTRDITISSIDEGETYSLDSDESWISFSDPIGTLPATVSVTLNAMEAGPGLHLGTLTLVAAGGTLELPVEFKVDPLRLTHITSDRHSSIVYASSEETPATDTPAYLLKIDTEAETILDVVEVGSSVTDVMLHPRENRLYVTNWRTGYLLALDPETLEHLQTYAFSEFGGMGYGENDVFVVAPGPAGRIVVEEQDQWIDARLFNTTTGEYVPEARISVREGGGDTDSTGRYYYHGDNNSSGATIQRYDLLGDTFTKLAEVRPEGINYGGSRTVVVSGDDSRVFWAKAVLDSELNSVWTTPEEIHSVTADGRYAFGADLIYDINRRLAVLGMPASTSVSAWNSTTNKLVTQYGNTVRFDPVGFPMTLPEPVITDAEATHNSITVHWRDNSLETTFHLQYRTASGTGWQDADTAIDQNRTAHTVSGLAEDTPYEFRLRAVSPDYSSSWSGVFSSRTTIVPPSAPYLSYPSVLGQTALRLSWSSIADTYDTLHIERRMPAEGDAWTEVAVLPASTRNSYDDTGLSPGTTYDYRVRIRKGDSYSPYSYARSATTRTPQPPDAPGITHIVPASATSLEIGWTARSDTASYWIEYRRAGEVDWAGLTEVPHPQATYVHTGLVEGQGYEYRVAGRNAVGLSPYSSSYIAVPLELQTLVEDTFDPRQDSRLWYQFGARIQPHETGEPGNYAASSQQAGSLYSYELDLTGAYHMSFRVIADNPESAPVTVLFSTDGYNYSQINTVPAGKMTVIIPFAYRRESARVGLLFGDPSEPVGIDDFTIHVTGTKPLEPVSHVLVSPLNATTTYLEWPLPEELRFDQYSNPYGAFQFRIERRTPGNDFAGIATVESRPDPYFLDTRAPSDTPLEYRIVRVSPWTDTAPSIPTSSRTRSQFQEWLEQNVPGAVDDAALAQSAPVRVAYAFGLTGSRVWDPVPFDPDSTDPGLPAIRYSQELGSLVLQFPFRSQDLNPGIGYQIEGSNNLVDWVPVNDPPIQSSLEGPWEMATCLLPESPYRFYRVRLLLE